MLKYLPLSKDNIILLIILIKDKIFLKNGLVSKRLQNIFLSWKAIIERERVIIFGLYVSTLQLNVDDIIYSESFNGGLHKVISIARSEENRKVLPKLLLQITTPKSINPNLLAAASA